LARLSAAVEGAVQRGISCCCSLTAADSVAVKLWRAVNVLNRQRNRFNSRKDFYTRGLDYNLVLCEYSKFRIDSIRNAHNYSEYLNTYHHQYLTYLTE